eukprot:412867_1
MMSTFDNENNFTQTEDEPNQPKWSRKCTMLILYGYIRPLVPKFIDISLYCSICFAFYRNLLPKFKLYQNPIHQLYLNQFNHNIISSKKLSRGGCDPIAVSTNPWTRILYNNSNTTFVHKFEIRCIGHNLKFSIGIISKNQLKSNCSTTYEQQAYMIKIAHYSSRYVLNRPYLYYQTPSTDSSRNNWKSAPIEEDWCHTGHKLGIAVNCKEWKLYFYCNDKQVTCINLDENETYYPILCVYTPDKPCQDTYKIVKYCTDLYMEDDNYFNDYIIKQLPRKSYQVEINVDIDKPETLFENLWKGKMLIDLRSYDWKLQNMFALMQADSFGHRYWRYSHAPDDFRRKIVGNQSIIKIWIIIEMYQHFRHNIYMDLIRKQLSNNWSNMTFVNYITDIITDYTMQNINEAYSEYFNNETNLENMTVLYCTIAISTGWRRSKWIRLNMNESWIEWMDEYVIPYIPYKYLFGVMNHHFIDYLTEEQIHPDDLIEEELTDGLKMELQDVYERRLDDEYIDRYHLEWSDIDEGSDDMIEPLLVRAKKKTKHREYNKFYKEEFVHGQESEFNSYP